MPVVATVEMQQGPWHHNRAATHERPWLHSFARRPSFAYSAPCGVTSPYHHALPVGVYLQGLMRPGSVGEETHGSGGGASGSGGKGAGGDSDDADGGAGAGSGGREGACNTSGEDSSDGSGGSCDGDEGTR